MRQVSCRIIWQRNHASGALLTMSLPNVQRLVEDATVARMELYVEQAGTAALHNRGHNGETPLDAFQKHMHYWGSCQKNHIALECTPSRVGNDASCGKTDEPIIVFTTQMTSSGRLLYRQDYLNTLYLAIHLSRLVFSSLMHSLTIMGSTPSSAVPPRKITQYSGYILSARGLPRAEGQSNC